MEKFLIHPDVMDNIKKDLAEMEEAMRRKYELNTGMINEVLDEALEDYLEEPDRQKVIQFALSRMDTLNLINR